jgi:hypothetical protein
VVGRVGNGGRVRLRTCFFVLRPAAFLSKRRRQVTSTQLGFASGPAPRTYRCWTAWSHPPTPTFFQPCRSSHHRKMKAMKRFGSVHGVRFLDSAPLRRYETRRIRSRSYRKLQIVHVDTFDQSVLLMDQQSHRHVMVHERYGVVPANAWCTQRFAQLSSMVSTDAPHGNEAKPVMPSSAWTLGQSAKRKRVIGA